MIISRTNSNTSKIMNINNNFHEKDKMGVFKKDDFSKGILKQVSNIQEQINKLYENETMPQKEKLERIEELKQQMEDLNKQLVEKQLEEQKEEREKQLKQSKKSSTENNTNKYDNSIEMKDILQINSSIKKIKTMSCIKSNLKSSSNILRAEAELDKARDRNGSASKIIHKKMAKANENENRANAIAGQIYKEATETINEIRTSQNEKTHKNKELEDNKKDATINNIYIEREKTPINVLA